MNPLVIHSDRITLKLLSREELVAWKEYPLAAEKMIGYPIDAEPIRDHLLFVFERKIENMNNDPENEKWLSYFALIFDNTIVGLIGPKGKPDENLEIEIGYGISKSYQNKGIMTEAVSAFCNHYFKNENVRSILAVTAPSNIASHKVLRKNGFFTYKSDNEEIHYKLTSLAV
jgi:ribosomal-protein-alanine N-acetyltransferase